jgi:AcrR family transcriptional regulator
MITDDRQTVRTDRRSRTREALLDAAQRLWAERGIRGASLDDIAGAANLTKGAVYSNFTGKTDLLLALLERHTTTDLGPDLSADAEEVGEDFVRRLGTEEARLLTLLMVELWLYGMRDFAAGWRIADWYEARRTALATQLDGEDADITTAERATLASALDIGLTVQHLLDPDRVPASTYALGLRMILDEHRS